MTETINSFNNSSILSAIVLSTEDAIISKELDGTITSWNPAAETMFGYSAKEAIGNNISIIIPGQLQEEEAEIMARIKNGKKTEHYDTMRKRKDESLFWAAITISPLRDENGVIVGASKIARDITEKKIAEEKQSLLASIIDSSDDAIVSKNLDGIITSWNKGAENIFGYMASEAIGKHISIIIPEFKLDEEKMIISKIRKGEKINHIETIRRTKNGTEINISLTISPVKDFKGRIIGASKIARDITEKAEMEKQKKTFTEQLQELNNYKDDFMVMASHELKTPLTVAKANLHVLDLVLSDEKQKNLLNKAFENLDKLSNLIIDLLDASKIQSGILALDIAEFNFIDLCKDVINKLELLETTHKINLHTSSNTILIKADKIRVEQVIMNMLTNAIKYSPGSKEVKADVVIENNALIVSVHDTGIGISKKDIEKIFTRFFRVRGEASTYPGSGIGLYISKEIIKRHGGHMWVKSEIGKGTTFYFSLPLKKVVAT